MTRHNAEKITGLDLDCIPNCLPTGPKTMAVRDLDGAAVEFTVKGWPSLFKSLVEAVYASRRAVAAYRQGYRCFSTVAFGPLECDHITSRARGARDDRLENLRMCSSAAHNSRHRLGEVLRIHPEVRKIAISKGWDWSEEDQQWTQITTRLF